MQREISTAGRGGAFNYNTPSSPSVLSQPTAFDLTSLYSSMLFPPSGLLLDDSQPSTETTVTPVLTPRFRQNHSSQLLIDQHYQQDLMDRHNRVLSQLLETEKKTLALRQENINLKMANFNLNNRLSLLLKASSDCGPSSGLGLDNGLRRMHVGVGHEEEMSSDRQSWEDLIADHHLSPTSVMDSGQAEGGDRVLLPKSISVRSNSYLKTIHAAGGSRPQNRIKSSGHTAQRVYVKGGGKKEEQPLELEVYNQGMFKTELCNKWQETGACPYGDNCQFAHGIEELRPVLRHPRYKTEVCRMVLNGDPCPYGHRCHFRHTLTDQEKLMRSLNSTTRSLIKP